MNALLLLGAVGFISNVATNGSRIAVPLLAVKLEASPLVVGLILASYAALPALVAISIGRWVDQVGPRLPLLLASGGLALGLFVPWAFPTLWALAVAAIMIGICMAVVFIAMQHTAGGLGDASNRTRIFTLLTVAQSVAVLVSPPITGLLIDHLGYRSAFMGLGIVAVALLGMLVLGGHLLPAATRRSTPGQKRLLELLRHPAVRSALIISSLGPVGWELLFFFVPLHGAHLGLSASTIGLVFTCFSTSIVGIRLAVPWLSKRISDWSLIAVAMGSAGGMFLLFPLTNSPGTMMALAALLGAGMGVSQPLTLSLVYVASPSGRQAEVLGMRTTTINAMATAAPLLLGVLSASVGLAAATWPFAILLMAGSRFAYRHNAALQGARP